jgi:hypothetical protein
MPLGLFQDNDSEYLSFPSIFIGQARTENKDRKISVHYSDICKWELRAVDRRVATSVSNLFYKMKKLQIKQISDKLNLAMRRCKMEGKTYHAGELLNPSTLSTVNEITRLDEGHRIFRTIRSSPPYFEARRKYLFAMIRQLGLPAWFISLSAAETRWIDMLRTLGTLLDNNIYSDEEIENFTWIKKCDLIKADHVTCVRFFDHRIHTFFKMST